MNVHLVFVAFNRLSYTQAALGSILADCAAFDLTVWDNGSRDGTQDYLMSIDDPRIVERVLKKENKGQVAAVNEVWSESKADLLGKCDNDCLVTPGWTGILGQAHADIPQLGVVACWPFCAHEFDERRAAAKIWTCGKHRVMRHPWTCGTGLLVKRVHFDRFGPLRGGATTQYWFHMASAGLVNGFYYPLVFQEHMDDPKSIHCMYRTRQGFEAAKTVSYGIQVRRQRTLRESLQWREEIVRNLLDDPYDPEWYIGWRARVRRVRTRAANVLRAAW